MENIENLDAHIHSTNKVARIWVVDLIAKESNIESYYDILSDDECIRAKKFKFVNDRNKFIVCRGVLRELSAKLLDKTAQTIAFNYGEFGKPYFAHDTTLNFNVSHSGDLAVICFLDNPTFGIDIELIKNDFDVLDIATNFFSESEIMALKETPKEIQPLAFYRCWTRKEAFIKAEGSGLSFPLDSFAVSMDSDDTASLLETKWDSREKEAWELYSFIPVQHYRAALAVRGKIKSLQINHW